MIAINWIKLWVEILDDPKMAALSDRLWRRTVELFLVAGENGGKGILPNLRDLAWRMRMDADGLETDLVEIAKTGIIEQINGVWVIPRFVERQAPMTGTERSKRYRQHRRESNATSPRHERDMDATHKRRGEEIREECDAQNCDGDCDECNEKNCNGREGAEHPRPRRSQKPVPTAVQVFREVVHRFPNKSLYQEIAEVVGEDSAALGRWRTHLLSWVKRGYNPTNLEGILQAFQGMPRKMPNPEGEAFDAELAEARRKLAEQQNG